MRHAAIPGLFAILLAGGCTMQTDGVASAAAASDGPTAQAELASADGSGVGMATLTETGDGLSVEVVVLGLAPGGVHGLHIHTVGRCDAPDFASAGGHWNPTAMKHGSEAPSGPHMGDMPNLTVAADGTGRLAFSIPAARLASGVQPLLDADGAAVVLHATADDYRTDPAGNSGARIACAIIRARP
jgi:Cu-Zn family superoxide dismutase